MINNISKIYKRGHFRYLSPKITTAVGSTTSTDISPHNQLHVLGHFVEPRMDEGEANGFIIPFQSGR